MRVGIVILCLLVASIANGQRTELGIWAGGSNYFGDLNNKTSFQFMSQAGGVFLRNNFPTRVSFKHSLSYGKIEFKDEISEDAWQRQRNLSFRSNIYELSTQFEFNFFKYVKGSKKHYYTPYFLVGFSAFIFNPQAEYQGTWYDLQPLGTEGQNDASFTGREKYRLISTAIPVGGGFRLNLNRHWDVGVEAATRKTFTDYLDDVSTSYVHPISLPGGQNGLAQILSDRSAELGEPIGTPGMQRGISTKKDDYFFVGFWISYTFINEHCPKPGRL